MAAVAHQGDEKRLARTEKREGGGPVMTIGCGFHVLFSGFEIVVYGSWRSAVATASPVGAAAGSGIGANVVFSGFEIWA